MLTERSRVSIVGAGAVGSTIAYAVMLRGLVHELVLVDALPQKAEAEAKDLIHGSMFVPRVEVSAGTVEDCRGSAVVVITAGAKQKPGQTRLQLVETNAALFRDLVPRILAAAPQALLLVVSNPVDVLTYISLRIAGVAPESVFGSGTVLDTSRFRALLARRLGVAVGNVHAYIVGEHGESETPIWSSAQIGGVPLDAVAAATAGGPLSEADRSEIVRGVRDAAAEVIAVKGATNWAIGLAAARILEAVLRDENRVLTVSGLVHGLDGGEDVCLSVPRFVSRRGAGEPLPLHYDESEKAALRHSAEILRETARRLGY
ncbi:MAG: L-lactate dehydrogenase [Acidobacteriota bacterium]